MTTDYREYLRDARRVLDLAKRALADQIAAYPTPISGCDAQFNHLLAERRRLDSALTAIDGEVFIPTPRSPMRQAGAVGL